MSQPNQQPTDLICPSHAERLPFKPFPSAALPSPVRQFVEEGAAAIGCDRSFVALPMLSTLAAAIGSTRLLKLKSGWNAPAIVWTAIVGESGAAKSPAFDLVTNLLAERQNRKLEPSPQKSMKEELEELRKIMTSTLEESQPQPNRYFVSDATIEAIAPILKTNPRGVLLCRDELSGWLHSFNCGGAAASNWLSLFHGRSLTVDRKTGDPRTIHVPHGYVSVTGGIQPAILRTALNGRHRESGLAARILFAIPPAVGKRWSENEISPNTAAAIANVIDRLYALEWVGKQKGAWQPEYVALSDDARAMWIEQFNRHNAEQANLTGDLARAWAKLEEYPARIALIVHCARVAADDSTIRDAGLVDVNSVMSGIIIAEWFKREAIRVYHFLDETPEQKLQRDLIDWIADNGGRATLRQVQRGRRSLGSASDIEKMLNVLATQKVGHWEQPSDERVTKPLGKTFVLNREISHNGAETGCDISQ